MTFNYMRYIAKMIGSVNPLTAATVSRSVNGAYNATNGVSAKTTSTYDCMINLGAATNNFNENIVQVGDLNAELAAEDLDFVPLAGDLLIITGGPTYKVIDVRPVFTGSEAVKYDLLVRK